MLYQFKIELSDVDREVYASLDFRVAQHPSESAPYLLSRVLAYALNYQEDLIFSPMGLSDPEAPALRRINTYGGTELWIEIGNTSTRKLHKAGKAAKQVLVYTYKRAEVLVEEIRNSEVHRANEIQIYEFSPKFLQELENKLVKNNRWSILHQQGHLDIGVDEITISVDVKKFEI